MKVVVGVMACSMLARQAFADPERGDVTIEVNLGVGAYHYTNYPSSGLTLAGPDLGIGAFVTDKLAILVRFSVTDQNRFYGEPSSHNAFIGPVLQYWVTPQLWIGGGLGVAVFQNTSNANLATKYDGGVALDLRSGFTFAQSHHHSASISFELVPSYYTDQGFDGLSPQPVGFNWYVTSYAVLIGYQYL